LPVLIDSTQIKTPTGLKVGTFRITKSERLASGLMSMEVIAVKRRLDLSWAVIKDVDLEPILDLLDSKVFHSVTYPDPQNGESATITAYLGDTGQEAGQKIAGTRYWQDVSIALVER